MKKVIIMLVSLLVLGYGISAMATTTTPTTTPNTVTVLTDLKDAIVKDVTDTVSTNVKSIQLATYKAQLEQKRQELADLEKSTTFAFIKYFKRIQLNSKIAELESKIKTIENDIEKDIKNNNK